MRELMIPESGAKRKLLEAAEGLFAERGFESVSVRDVSQAAGMNVAAVNYHFGSRAGLLATVILRYGVPVQEERMARMDVLERRGGKFVAVEELLEALIRPILLKSAHSEMAESAYYQLLGYILMDNGASLPSGHQEIFRQVALRFNRLLGKALPEVSVEESWAKIQFIEGSLIHLLLRNRQWAEGVGAPVTMEGCLGRLMRFGAAGFYEGVTGEVSVVPDEGPQATFDF